jgi:phage terminase large subunit
MAMSSKTTFRVPYKFYGGNLAAIKCKAKETMLDGPAETGKTLAELWRLHACALKYPGAQFAIIRKKKTDLHGSVLRTFTRDILEPYAPFVDHYGGKVPQWYDYPGGSRIWLGGLDEPGKTLSSERDIIYVCQAAQLSLNDWEMLTRCVTGRGKIMPYTQLRGDCNPAHPTSWIIQRGRDGKLKRFTSTHRDNPTLWNRERSEWTAQGIETRETLGNMTGARRKRLFQGLWAAPEGAIFEVFDESRHKVSAFEIPPSWPRFAGVDPVGAYVAAIWIAYDPADQVFHVYREYCEPFGIPTSKHVKNMLDLSQGEFIHWWATGGPSERQQRLDFQSHGLPACTPGVSDVWAGIDRLIEALDGRELVVHDSCPKLLDEIGSYSRKIGRDGLPDEKTIQDKDKYHLIDSTRYAWVGPERNAGGAWYDILPR